MLGFPVPPPVAPKEKGLAEEGFGYHQMGSFTPSSQIQHQNSCETIPSLSKQCFLTQRVLVKTQVGTLR